jgi:hypothetical protein
MRLMGLSLRKWLNIYCRAGVPIGGEVARPSPPWCPTFTALIRTVLT